MEYKVNDLFTTDFDKRYVDKVRKITKLYKNVETDRWLCDVDGGENCSCCNEIDERITKNDKGFYYMYFCTKCNTIVGKEIKGISTDWLIPYKK